MKMRTMTTATTTTADRRTTKAIQKKRKPTIHLTQTTKVITLDTLVCRWQSWSDHFDLAYIYFCSSFSSSTTSSQLLSSSTSSSTIASASSFTPSPTIATVSYVAGCVCGCTIKMPVDQVFKASLEDGQAVGQFTTEQMEKVGDTLEFERLSLASPYIVLYS